MNVTIAPQYQPHAKQFRVHNSGRRFVVVSAGVRGGKSYSATVEFVRRIYIDFAAGKGKKSSGTGKRRQPRLLYWIVSPTMDLAKIPYRYLQEIIPPELIEHQSQSDYSIWLRGDILIEVKSAERPQTLVGAAVNGMLVDEAARVKAEAWKGSLRGRLTDTLGWALFASSPLGGRNSWVYQELVSQDGTDEQIESVTWKTIDNPYIDPTEIEAARRQLPDAWFKRDYEASWDSFGGSIYSEFGESHVISEAAFRLEFGLGNKSAAPIFRRIVCGVDFGFTSPGAMVVVGHLGEDRYVVLDESYAAQRPILGNGTTWLSEARRLKEKWGVQMFICDPARPDAIHDLQTNGVTSIPGWNDIYLGIRRVSEGMHPVGGVPGLRVLDHCRNVVTEARSYLWKQTKDGGGFAEVPAEGQLDHALDALRYAVTELRPFSVPQKQNVSGFGARNRPVF